MKKINLVFSVLILSTVLFFSCKKEPNVPPVADTELQTAIDASYATFLVSDIEMVCSFGGEGGTAQSNPKFYNYIAAETGTMYIVRDLATNRISINFNNTLCKDGRTRDGSIFMFFKEQEHTPVTLTGNENYTRDYNFVGRITLEEYKVDGWLIDNSDIDSFDPNQTNYPILLKNLRPNGQPPVVGDLKWSLQGSFKMKKNQDSMSWKGKFIKTLENTEDPLVFNPNTQVAINWSLAVISYTGSAYGTTPGNVPFSYSIYQTTPIKRDFLCFPDKIAGVTLTPTLGIAPQYSESHPFTAGVASFTTGTAYPREIYYDNAENSYGGPDGEVLLPAQCDNKATVQIKGIFYPIDLKK